MSDTMLLENRVVILSGLGPGTGLALFETLALHGATVVSCSRSNDLAEHAANMATSAGLQTMHLPCDITVPEDCEAVVKKTVDTFGGVDGLVCNAFASGMPASIEQKSIQDAYGLPFKVNVFGTMQMIRAAVPALKSRGGGSIVAINSMAARIIPDGMTAYGASKAALLAAIQGVAKELGMDGVRANSVVPSHIDGPNLAMLLAYEMKRRSITKQQARDEIIALGALDHITTPREIADAVVFLLSDMSRGITGQSLDVNAGQCFV